MRCPLPGDASVRRCHVLVAPRALVEQQQHPSYAWHVTGLSRVVGHAVNAERDVRLLRFDHSSLERADRNSDHSAVSGTLAMNPQQTTRFYREGFVRLSDFAQTCIEALTKRGNKAMLAVLDQTTVLPFSASALLILVIRWRSPRWIPGCQRSRPRSLRLEAGARSLPRGQYAHPSWDLPFQ